VRWLAVEPVHLLDSDLTAYDGLRSSDLTFVLSARVLLWYSKLLPRGSFVSREVRRQQLQTWSAEDDSLPSFSCTVKLLEYFLNNVDILDVLHRQEDDTFEVQTEFLDTYAKKEGVGLVGATIRLEPDPAGERPGDWRIVHLRQGTTTYTREEVAQDMAHRVYTGLAAYVTVATHTFHLHYQASHRRAIVSESILPRNSPLRDLLLPTELGTTSAIGRGVVLLLAPQGIFSTIFPFQYRGGLDRMVEEYRPWDPADPADHRTQLVITKDRSLHPVLGDYQRWWAYIERHLTPVVEELAGGDSVTTWRTAMNNGRSSTVGHLATLAFFAQVRHNFLSNETFAHMARYGRILEPGPFNVSNAALVMILSVSTKLRWVPLTRGFAPAGCHPNIVDFYSGLEVLGASMRHPLSMPEEIEVSTGM
jgi:hypothetical protein